MKIGTNIYLTVFIENKEDVNNEYIQFSINSHFVVLDSQNSIDEV